jgi:hypothetical protein
MVLRHNLLYPQIDYFPNATIAEYGTLHYDTDAIMGEIFARGRKFAIRILVHDFVSFIHSLLKKTKIGYNLSYSRSMIVSLKDLHPLVVTFSFKKYSSGGSYS